MIGQLHFQLCLQQALLHGFFALLAGPVHESLSFLGLASHLLEEFFSLLDLASRLLEEFFSLLVFAFTVIVSPFPRQYQRSHSQS